MSKSLFQMYQEELKQIPPCTPQEEKILPDRAKEGDEGARKRLLEGMLYYALELVSGFRNKGIPAADLVQEANMALVMAVGDYEGGGFEGFLRQRVREALGAAVESQSLERRTAEKMVDRVNRLKDISAEVAEELGREATVEELARRMELTEEEIREAMKVTMDAMTLVER